MGGWDLSSRGARGKTRGVYGSSSLVKFKLTSQKGGGNYAVFYFSGFIFLKKSIMKCLRSKKRKKSPVITTDNNSDFGSANTIDRSQLCC